MAKNMPTKFVSDGEILWNGLDARNYYPEGRVKISRTQYIVTSVYERDNVRTVKVEIDMHCANPM